MLPLASTTVIAAGREVAASPGVEGAGALVRGLEATPDAPIGAFQAPVPDTAWGLAGAGPAGIGVVRRERLIEAYRRGANSQAASRCLAATRRAS
jgi:hypothetical protein